MSLLEDLQGSFMDEPCMDTLGDTIRFKPDGGAWATIHAYVDFSEQGRTIEAGMVVEQNMLVTVLMRDVPVKPNANCRVTLRAVPGQTFKPANVARDASGTHWIFELVRVNV